MASRLDGVRLNRFLKIGASQVGIREHGYLESWMALGIFWLVVLGSQEDGLSLVARICVLYWCLAFDCVMW